MNDEEECKEAMMMMMITTTATPTKQMCLHTEMCGGTELSFTWDFKLHFNGWKAFCTLYVLFAVYCDNFFVRSIVTVWPNHVSFDSIFYGNRCWYPNIFEHTLSMGTQFKMRYAPRYLRTQKARYINCVYSNPSSECAV